MRAVGRTGVYRLDTFWPVRESPHRSSHGAGRGRNIRTRRDAESTRTSLICHEAAIAFVTADASAHDRNPARAGGGLAPMKSKSYSK
jgi:hypothetical protein